MAHDWKSAPVSRRVLLKGAGAAALAAGLPFAASRPAFATTEKVGILIPGSKSDKGWMESGYDGLVAAQKKHGEAIKVQMIET